MLSKAHHLKGIGDRLVGSEGWTLVQQEVRRSLTCTLSFLLLLRCSWNQDSSSSCVTCSRASTCGGGAANQYQDQDEKQD